MCRAEPGPALVWKAARVASLRPTFSAEEGRESTALESGGGQLPTLPGAEAQLMGRGPQGSCCREGQRRDGSTSTEAQCSPGWCSGGAVPGSDRGALFRASYEAQPRGCLCWVWRHQPELLSYEPSARTA